MRIVLTYVLVGSTFRLGSCATDRRPQSCSWQEEIAPESMTAYSPQSRTPAYLLLQHETKRRLLAFIAGLLFTLNEGDSSKFRLNADGFAEKQSSPRHVLH